jgi:hypothetical protein
MVIVATVSHYIQVGSPPSLRFLSSVSTWHTFFSSCWPRSHTLNTSVHNTYAVDRSLYIITFLYPCTIMRPSLLFFSGLLALFTTPGTAIRAVPSQQCAAACGNVTTTSSNDIVCSDADFQNTPKGQAMQNCLSCQQNSTANDPNTGESDLRWFICSLS